MQLQAAELARALYWVFVAGNIGLLILSSVNGVFITKLQGQPGVREAPVFMKRGIKMTFGTALAISVTLSLVSPSQMVASPSGALLLLCANCALAVPVFFNLAAWEMFVRSPSQPTGLSGSFAHPQPPSSRAPIGGPLLPERDRGASVAPHLHRMRS